MKTHTLAVVTVDGLKERKVDGAERLVVKAGTDMRAFKVSDLSSVIVDEFDGNASARLMIAGTDGRGEYPRRIFGSARIELGDDRWQISELLGLTLFVIPPPKPEVPPLSKTYRIRYLDAERPDEIVTGESAQFRCTIPGTLETGFQETVRTWTYSELESVERVPAEEFEAAEAMAT